MKIKLLLFTLSLFAIVSCNKSNNGTVGSGSSNLEANIDSVSYGFGVDIGNSLATNGINELNIEAFSDGLVTMLNKDSVKIKPEDARKLVMEYIQKLHEQKTEQNKKDGEAFLEENKSKEGVVTTESGLQYIVIKEGTGPIPADTAKVRVHYHGTLIDGTVFESTVEKGEPAEFPVNGVIKGWQEALKLMPVGSKWKVFIPTDLAYGKNVQRGGKILPNMALIFEMELLEILAAEKSNPIPQNGVK